MSSSSDDADEQGWATILSGPVGLTGVILWGAGRAEWHHRSNRDAWPTPAALDSCGSIPQEFVANGVTYSVIGPMCFLHLARAHERLWAGGSEATPPPPPPPSPASEVSSEEEREDDVVLPLRKHRRTR